MASQKDIRSLLNPIYNSTWDKALTKLREQTPPDAIINAWWSPGHFIKAEAWRRVIFDGASIRGDIAYWLNKIYLSQTEEEALGILRMVNTGSNEATLFLEKAGWPLSKAVRLITGIVALPRNEASDILRKVLSANDTQKVLDLTHGKGKLPPSYLLVYNENVDGNILFAYLDKWNFDRIETLNANPEAVRRVPAKSSPAFVTFIWDLVGGPYRQSNVLNPVAENGTRIRFDQGVEIDTASMSARIESPTFGRGIPASIVYLNADGQVTERTLPNATLSYSLVFFRDQNAPRAALMDRRLANSLIIKMYYFDGAGLVHFKPFAKEADLSGRTKIFIYEVKWPKVF
jgi:hypothetical protein